MRRSDPRPPDPFRPLGRIGRWRFRHRLARVWREESRIVRRRLLRQLRAVEGEELAEARAAVERAVATLEVTTVDGVRLRFDGCDPATASRVAHEVSIGTVILDKLRLPTPLCSVQFRTSAGTAVALLARRVAIPDLR